MQYTKPALPFQEQADLLLKRGMAGDKSQIADRLSVVSYYRLSGYWHCFRKKSPSGAPAEEFEDGTNFDTVWNRYVFDRSLRLLVMDAIERMEIVLRGQISYHHSQKHGPFDDRAKQLNL